MKISVVTVVFNDAENIRATIESVLFQDHQDTEYIIIDGGSTDCTLEVIHEYAPRIDHIVSEPDNGIYDAQNKGILLSRGKYVNFLNCGDTYYTNKILTEINIIATEKSPCIIYGDIYKVFSHGPRLYRAPRKLATVKWGRGPSHQATWIRHDVLKGTNGFDTRYRSAAAFDFFCKVQRRGLTYYSVDAPLVNFRAGGFSSEKTLTYRERYTIIRRAFGIWYGCIFYVHRIVLEQGVKRLLMSIFPGLRRGSYQTLRQRV